MFNEQAIRQLLASAAVAAWAASATPAETAPAAAKSDRAKAPQAAAQLCAACHGADGNSVIPANPSLAGQHAEYITKQLANYKSGARRNAIMSQIVANLSDQDMKSLGEYFSSRTPQPGAAHDRALAELGQKIYRGGVAANGVPACAGCHAPDATGIPAEFPRLAGQHSEYVLAQLKSFRAWERANDNAKMMRMIAGRLSDREMQALAEYISGLGP